MYKKPPFSYRLWANHKNLLLIIGSLLLLWLLLVGLENRLLQPDFPYGAMISGFVILSLMVLSIFIHIHYRFVQLKELEQNNARQQQALQSILALISLKSPLPEMGNWAAAADFMKIIGTFILEQEPKVIVECGSGTSSIIMAYFLEKNEQGHLYALESEGQYAIQTRQKIEQHQLENYATILEAPLQSLMLGEQHKWYASKQTQNLPPIDLLVIDGPRGNRYPALPVLFDHLSENAVIIVDDCKREKDTKVITRWLDEFPLSVEWLDTEKGTGVLRFKK